MFCRLVFSCMLAALVVSPLPAKLTLPKFFTDNMVLQRGIEVPVWGWSDPGESIKLTFPGQSQSTIADGRGQWMLRLKPMEASAESRTLTINDSIELNTVVVTSDEVAKPVAVRYAYRMNPVGANLYNKAGLPAAPFRSDDW